VSLIVKISKRDVIGCVNANSNKELYVCLNPCLMLLGRFNKT